MGKKFKLGLCLFLIGFAGVLSMLTVQISLPGSVTSQFSPAMVKLLVLVNPTILLLLAVWAGTALHDKVALTVPAVSSALGIKPAAIGFTEQVKWGTVLGIVGGLLLVLVSVAFKSSIPESFTELSEKVKLTMLARFLYGGLTEEILMRYGLMTLLVWIAFKISGRLNAGVYWLGIVVATLLFALGHFPVVFAVTANASASLLLYVLLGNSVAGIIFGWLYWKKGLEAAFMAHIFCHVVMLVLG